MTWEEYEVLERPFGWKVEYWDGHARLTPRSAGVKTHLDLTSLVPIKHRNAQEYNLAAADATYTDQMVAGYFETFADSIEFCDYPAEKVQESAERDITNYFSEKRGEALPASVIALAANTQELIGLALFVLREEHRPQLDLLYVRSPHQRKGIATAMLNHGIHHLSQANFKKLFSSYHICNNISRQWHHKQGFKDIHDLYYLQIKVGWLNNEVWRREKLKPQANLDELRKKQEHFQTKLEEAERKRTEEFNRLIEEHKQNKAPQQN